MEALAKELTRLGVTNFIAAPHTQNVAYKHNALHVLRFKSTSKLNDLSVLYGEGDTLAAASFDTLLAREQPDLVHLHAYTSAISLRTIEVIKRRGIPVVFTYHTPTVSCARGTLLRWGSNVCDGMLDERLCAQCVLNKLGIGYPFNALLAALPPNLSELGRIRQGGAWTALRMRNLIHQKHAATRQFLQQMDRIVVLCRWTQELLERNGIPQAQMYLSPHGLSLSSLPQPKQSSLPPQPVRFVYFGRIDPVKGLDVVIQAIRQIPNTVTPFTLDIYGVVQAGAEDYKQHLINLIGNDQRITFHPPVNNQSVLPLLENYHFLLVPSQWLETGPLVVLEAFAAGTPVVGSNLGGIAELVQDGVNGLLVEPNSVSDWVKSLERVLQDSTLYPRLKAAVRPPRLMSDVAKDMFSVYTSLLSSRY